MALPEDRRQETFVGERRGSSEDGRRQTLVPGLERRKVAVRGTVWGVGFRPFIHSLAQRYRLSDLVYYDAEGACIEVEGPQDDLDRFLRNRPSGEGLSIPDYDADPSESEDAEGAIVETRGIIAGVVKDVLAGCPDGEIGSVFHRTMAETIAAACLELPDIGGVNPVALSGGTFQNALLLRQVVELLEEQGFTVYQHYRVPTNDGGLSPGQAMLVNRMVQH